jgi:hypothetical protein
MPVLRKAGQAFHPFIQSTYLRNIILPGLLIVFILFACTKNTGVDYTPDCSSPKSYSADVSPIIQSYCATNSGCHATGSHEGPGALTGFEQVYNNRASIRSAVANGSMPENTRLSAEQKNAILCWIDNGANNN